MVLNHLRIKVACKVPKSFLTLFPVTLVKVEIQESNLHQMNPKKVYFLTRFMQNVQKLHKVGCRALNDWANHYGPPCSWSTKAKWVATCLGHSRPSISLPLCFINRLGGHTFDARLNWFQSKFVEKPMKLVYLHVSKFEISLNSWV